MIIEYLNLLKKTTLILGRENEGVSFKKIEEYEQATNILFPKAYKEFLSLSGFSTGVLGFQNNGGFPEYSHKQQKYTKETLKRYGVSIGEDFWVIADLDGGGQFDFFYFNDPDAEDPENPPVYASYPDLIEDNDPDFPLKKKLANTFQEYIEEKIKAYANLK